MQIAALSLATILLVPLSSQTAVLRFPGTVLVEPDATNGLRSPSVALVFQLRASDRRLIGASVEKLSTDKLSEVPASLGELTGL